MATASPPRRTQPTRSPRCASRFRTTPIALRNVTHQLYKSITAIGGICLAITLVLLQLGFLEAVKFTATNVYNHLDFDVALVSVEYEQFYKPGLFPLERLMQARSASPAVIQASPLYVRMNLWRCPPPAMVAEAQPPIPRFFAGLWNRLTGQTPSDKPFLRALCVIGFDPDLNCFRPPIRDDVQTALPQLLMANTVIMDTLSHPDFGWSVHDQFHGFELGFRQVDIVGSFTMGKGFEADATVICTDENFDRFCFGASLDRVGIGLLKLADGANAAATADAINSALPPDVIAYTRAQVNASEENYWVSHTATGILFGFGVFVALCVGTVVVYQVLTNDVTNHYAEYATLKALGYTNAALAWVVTQQSLIYAISAYIPALVLAFALYRATEILAGVPMFMTWSNAIMVLILTIIMCLVSALLTLRRVFSADPATLL